MLCSLFDVTWNQLLFRQSDWLRFNYLMAWFLWSCWAGHVCELKKKKYSICSIFNNYLLIIVTPRLSCKHRTHCAQIVKTPISKKSFRNLRIGCFRNFNHVFVMQVYGTCHLVFLILGTRSLRGIHQKSTPLCHRWS
jgi:hypothetical protein